MKKEEIQMGHQVKKNLLDQNKKVARVPDSELIGSLLVLYNKN
jgi:hypothetical protein